MAKKRPNPRILDELEKQRQIATRQIESARILAEGCGTEFWKRMSQVIEAKKKAVGLQLLGYLSLEQDTRNSLLQQQVDFEMFLRLPQDFANNLNLFEKKLLSIKEKIEEYKEKIESGGE